MALWAAAPPPGKTASNNVWWCGTFCNLHDVFGCLGLPANGCDKTATNISSRHIQPSRPVFLSLSASQGKGGIGVVLKEGGGSQPPILISFRRI